MVIRFCCIECDSNPGVIDNKISKIYNTIEHNNVCDSRIYYNSSDIDTEINVRDFELCLECSISTFDNINTPTSSFYSFIPFHLFLVQSHVYNGPRIIII